MVNKNYIFWALIFFACIFRVLSVFTVPVSYLLLAGCCMFGARQVIVSLAFTWLFVMLNPALSPSVQDFGHGKYLVFFASFVSLILRSWFSSYSTPRKKIEVSKINVVVFGFLTIFLVHSVFFSVFPVLSFLKLCLLGLLVFTLLSAWGTLYTSERVRVRHFLFCFLVGVSFISLPLLFFPTGYLANGSGFQGILNQPQVFGVTLAILGVLAFSELLERKDNLRLWLLFVGVLFLIFMSEARISGLSLILALMSSFLFSLLKSCNRLYFNFKGLVSVYSIVFLFVSLFVFFLKFPFFHYQIDEFISKGGRDGNVENVADAFHQSRGFLINRMLINIENNPWSGIGFGVSSDLGSSSISVDPVFGIPLSAPTEKGVLPVSIVEEFGLIFGAAVFLLLFCGLVRASRFQFFGVSIVLLIYFLNMGEAMLFSPGGVGLLVLIFYTSVMVRRVD